LNRSNYFDYIEEKIIAHAASIEARGKSNILNYHVHSENFYRDLLNILFDWELENLNATKQNVEALDLVDHLNKIAIQVSATTTKAKVESALKKDLSSYDRYDFKFMSISKNADKLRAMTFNNPTTLTFSPVAGIFDPGSILNRILGLSIDKQRKLYELVKKELGSDTDPFRIESNLATLIDVLSKEDWRGEDSEPTTTPYDVEKKIEFNSLDAAKDCIDDYKIHYGRLDKIYSEFDKNGANKSKSILQSIRADYLRNQNQLSGDQLFFKVLDSVTARIQGSENYNQIAFEELELCVNILVVDAFIRCKIFKNPETIRSVTA